MRTSFPLQFEQIFGLAQRSQDELFHIALYNWLIQADLADKLLEVLSGLFGSEYQAVL